MASIPSLEKVGSIIAVHSAKGGVGKSTVTVNLACALAAKGARVGMLDADVHGPSGAMMMGTGEWPDPGPVENSIQPIKAHGVSFISIANMTTRETPLIWRGPMVSSVIGQLLSNVWWGELDYLFIDMPPGTGDAQLTLAQTVPLTGAIIVSTPQELALEDTLRGIRGFGRVNVPILGMIENMSWFTCDGCDTKTFPFGEEGAVVLAQEAGIDLLGRLPLEPHICQGGDTGKPFTVAHPNSTSSRAMNGIVSFIVEKLEDMRSTPTSFDLTWREMGWNERVAQAPEVDTSAGGELAAIWQVSFDELGVLWADGTQNVLPVRALRLACPCARCVDEMTGKPLLDPETVPANITLKEVKSVGRYALMPVFSDDHRSGLFHFERLRKIAVSK